MKGMVRKNLTNKDIYMVELVNLEDVITNTSGDSIDTEAYRTKTFSVIVSSNTGSVIVTIETSTDNVNWIPLFSKTYTTNTSDTFSYVSHFSYMRSTTTSQTNATVKSSFTGRS